LIRISQNVIWFLVKVKGGISTFFPRLTLGIIDSWYYRVLYYIIK